MKNAKNAEGIGDR